MKQLIYIDYRDWCPATYTGVMATVIEEYLHDTDIEKAYERINEYVMDHFLEHRTNPNNFELDDEENSRFLKLSLLLSRGFNKIIEEHRDIFNQPYISPNVSHADDNTMLITVRLPEC